MPPLPRYTFRPLKRTTPTRLSTGTGLKQLADTVSTAMSIKSGRLSVKTETGREKPQLKVLGRS